MQRSYGFGSQFISASYKEKEKKSAIHGNGKIEASSKDIG